MVLQTFHGPYLKLTRIISIPLKRSLFPPLWILIEEFFIQTLENFSRNCAWQIVANGVYIETLFSWGINLKN